MRSFRRDSARARRRSFLASGGISLWNHFRPRLEILEDRRMLAVYAVNSTADLVDATPGDGICLTPIGTPQVCTLRAAIMETNANSGLDTIQLPSGTYPLNLVGLFEDAAATGDLDVTDELILQGANAATTIITAAELGDRVFHVLSKATSVLMDNVTITGAGTEGRGANGGGIFNQGTLLVTNSQVQFNSAPNGGGIYNDSIGNLTITSSSLAANSADDSGGGIFNVGALKVTDSSIATSLAANFGGGIHNTAGMVTLSGSSVSGGNLAASGGGISNANAGTVTIDTSTVAGNFGGGIYNNGGTVQLESSTVTGNFGPDGAGIRNTDGGTLTLTNTTVSANSTGTSGGGIYNASGNVTLTDSTLTGNTASASGGGIFVDSGNVTLMGSTVIGNSAKTDGGGIYNQALSLTLQNSTVTINTAGGSGGGIYSASGAVTLTNCFVNGNLANSGDGGAIYAGAGSLTLDGGSVFLNTAKKDGGGIFHLQGFADLVGSTVSGNTADTGSGGGIFSSGQLTLTDVRVLSNQAEFESEGGGIFSSSLLNIADSTIENNHAGIGGGISASGILNISGSVIADNGAGGLTAGGGGGIHSTGTLSLDSSQVLGNDVGAGSPIGGGGILNAGTATIMTSTIADNATLGIGGMGGKPGGGIANSGTLTLRDSTVSGNSAHVGGGIENSGILTVVNSTISENKNPTTGFGFSGPGAGIFTSGIVTLTNATLYNNVALVDPFFGVGDGSSIFVDAGGIASVRNSIIGDDDPTNVDNECFVVPGGLFTSLGHNLYTGATCGLAGPGDLSGVHPLLSPLQDNGGPTFTHALLMGSPAIDAGDNSASAVTGPFDQRGFTRVADGNGDGTAVIDIGAYERVPLDRPIGCATFVDQGTLFVIADGADNTVAIVGTERGVQVTCDGQTEVFAGVTAANVQLGGGNDRITMRDDNGTLANANWKLATGTGNDKIEAVFKSNPNEFFVEAGLGDDDVSIRFVGIPQVPEPNELMPVIDVDMGAGVDGLLLDIFGSRESPPIDFAASGITPSVTLLEVLTSIFISGVGLLALLTLFPLGAMEMHQAVQDDRTGHIHETAAAIVLDAANFSADIQTGSTADEILIGLVPRPDSKIKVNLKSGDADDEVTVSTKEEKDDDDKGSSLNEEVPVLAAAYDLAFDLGGGNDRLDLTSVTGAGPLDFALDVLPGQFVLPEVGDKVIVAIEHGDIDRPFVLGTIWNTAPPPPNDPNGLAPTPGKLTLDVLGIGNQLAMDLNVLGSNGPDLLNVDTELSNETIMYVLDISGSMDWGSASYSGLDGPGTNVDRTVQIDTGRGDNVVLLNLQSAASQLEQKVQINTGDGDDSVDVNIDTSSANIPSTPCNIIGIDTGAGSDNVLLKVTGSFHEILIGLLMGEGDDTIQFEAADLHLADGGHADWSFLDGGGQDGIDLRLVDSSAGNDVKWNWTTGGGGGNDQIKVHIDEVLIGDRFSADWSLQGGEGDNHIDFVRCGMIVGAEAIYSWSVGAGGGSDLLTVMLEDLAFGDGSVVKYLWNLGLGDDTAKTDASHLMLGMGTAFSWDITTGGLIGEANATDDDGFTATLTDLHLAEGSSFHWLLSTGDGLDTTDTRWTGPTLSPGQTAPGLIDLALDSGAGNDSLATSFLDVPFDVTLNIAAGAGDDVIDTRWTGPTLIPDSPCVIVGIDAGLGSDAVAFMADGAWEELDPTILTGDGADVVNVGISNPAPAEGGEEPKPPEEPRRRTAVSLRTGDRNDTVKTSFVNVPGDISLDIDTAAGDDLLNTIYVGSANGGVWKTTNSMGEGDDTATLAMSPRDPASSLTDSFIDTGDGADGVTVLLRRLANPGLPPSPEEPPGLDQLEIITGAGNDTINVQLESAAAALAQKVHIDSGTGDDHVEVNAPPAARDGLADLIVGSDAGIQSHVKVFDGGSIVETSSFIPYAGFGGGVRVASGDVNGDGVADIVTGAGPGAGPHVKVFDGRSGAELRSFFAYGPSFAGGIYVAAGDLNGDGFDDIITGTGAGAPGGHVKVFDGTTGALMHSFLTFSGFSGGVTVAAGDVNGDGRDDIITGAGPGAPGGHVKVFSGANLALLHSFLAYGGFSGGVFVAAGDVDGDGRADIVTGTDAGAAGGHVKVFSGATGTELRSFLAYDDSVVGGVRVAAGDVNNDGFADIVTGAGPGATGGHVKVFDGATGAETRSFFAFDTSFAGGIFVAAGDLHSSARPLSLALDLAIETGAGRDVVSTELSSAADQITQKVRIDTGVGNDSAAIELLPYIEQDNLYQFQVDLGAGNDVARYWVFGTELPPAVVSEQLAQAPGRLEFQVRGGLGIDDIQGRIGANRAGQSLPLAIGQALIDIDGGAGNDRISLDFKGTILDDESVDAILHGGDGNDQVRARFDLGPASTGKLSAQVFGDAGNDELGLAILGSEQLDEFFALLDGGKGRDKCRVTKNVIVRNCEL